MWTAATESLYREEGYSIRYERIGGNVVLKLYSMTDVGRKREINEDYVYASKEPVGRLENLFIVADGMGGHKAGDYASEHTVKRIVEVIGDEQADSTSEIEKILQRAIDEANSYIYLRSKQEEALNGMGTTLVVATCNQNTLTVANVGDSRLYLINDAITQITQDHSLVEEMVSLGGIDREAARKHPDKNIITRAVGVGASVNADFYEVELMPGDKILLCTDGLTNMLRDEEIHKIIREHEDIEQAVKQLIIAANEQGGRDNIGVVLVEPQDTINSRHE